MGGEKEWERAGSGKCSGKVRKVHKVSGLVPDS